MAAVFGFMVFLAFGGFLYLLYLVATSGLRKRAAAQARVAEINAEHGLSFDVEHILVNDLYLSAEDDFVAFDQQHRKLAICSRKDKTFCRIEDFSWLRGWSHTWESRGNSIFHRIELETADLDCPVLFFRVESEYEASQWIARLNLLING